MDCVFLPYTYLEIDLYTTIFINRGNNQRNIAPEYFPFNLTLIILFKAKKRFGADSRICLDKSLHLFSLCRAVKNFT